MNKLFNNKWLLVTVITLLLLLLAWFFVKKEEQTKEALPLIAGAEISEKATKGEPAITFEVTSPEQTQRQAISSSFEQCKPLLLPRADPRAWRKEKRHQLRELLTTQKAQGVEPIVFDEFFKRTAMGLTAGRALLNGYVSKAKHPRFSAKAYERASQDAFKKALLVVLSNDPAALADAVSNKALSSDKSYYHDGDSYTLFTFLRKAAISPKQNIDVLLNAGIEIVLADLAQGTVDNFDTQTLEKMMLNTQLDITATLRDRHSLTSLTLIALAHQNWSLAQFWLNHNSPAEVDLADKNGLDILADNIEKIPEPQLTELLTAIVEQGIDTAQYRSVVTLKNHFNDSALKSLIASLSVKKTLNKQQFELMKELAEQYYFDLLEGGVSFDLSQTPKHRCFDFLARWLSRYVAIGPRQRKVEKAPNTQMSAKFEKPSAPKSAMQLDEQAKRILQNKAIYQSPQDDQSLESKLILERKRISDINALAKSLNVELEDKKDKPQYKLIEQIIVAAQGGQWQQALELTRQLQADSAGVYSSLLVIAINTNANFATIKQLIEYGAALDSSVMTTLIMKNNVELTKQLQPYGLDIHEYAMGYSPLARAVQHKAKAMLKYLLSQGVLIDSDSLGFDALDLALKGYGSASNDSDYIKLLLDAGAEIEASHRQSVEQIKHKDVALYSQLLNAEPRLKQQ